MTRSLSNSYIIPLIVKMGLLINLLIFTDFFLKSKGFSAFIKSSMGLVGMPPPVLAYSGLLIGIVFFVIFF